MRVHACLWRFAVVQHGCALHWLSLNVLAQTASALVLPGGLAVNVTVWCHVDVTLAGLDLWSVCLACPCGLLECPTVCQCARPCGNILSFGLLLAPSRHVMPPEVINVSLTIAERLPGVLQTLFMPGLAGHVRSLLQQRPPSMASTRIVCQSWSLRALRLTAPCCSMSRRRLGR